MWTDVKHARTVIEKTSGRIAKKKKKQKEKQNKWPQKFVEEFCTSCMVTVHVHNITTRYQCTNARER